MLGRVEGIVINRVCKRKALGCREECFSQD